MIFFVLFGQGLASELKESESETKIFVDEKDTLDELVRYEEKVMKMFQTNIQSSISRSIFQRDAFGPYLLWFDITQWVVDAIRNKDSGKPYRSEYIWRE